ncbi:MAG: (2Fe-2S)-binding protein [Comamonas sp.]
MAHADQAMRAGQLQRLKEQGREAVDFVLNGQPTRALQGDTVLTAVLTQSQQLRTNEFAGTPRAGFCMMGACQDCWVTLGGVEAGRKVRACSTMVCSGMQVCTTAGAVAAAAQVEVQP